MNIRDLVPAHYKATRADVYDKPIRAKDALIVREATTVRALALGKREVKLPVIIGNRIGG